MDSFVLKFDKNDLPKQFKNEIIERNDEVSIRSNVNCMEEINEWVKKSGKNTQTSLNSRTSMPQGRRFVCSFFMSTNKSSELKEWFPQNILNGKGAIAILLLNQPLSDENKIFLKEFWNSAAVRVAVDGGVNHLKEMFNNDMLHPNIISGDFDSALPENIEFFQEMGTNVIPTPDQNATDFTKALKLTIEYITKNNLKVSSIIAVVRNGERLDHLFGNLNTLYLASCWTSIPIYILGNFSLTWLLTKGIHKIHVPDNMRESNIGLIPLGEECTDVTTTGLKWNLTHDKMKFGNLVSTSNRFGDEAKEVVVTTDTELIWTMEVKM